MLDYRPSSYDNSIYTFSYYLCFNKSIKVLG